jgi:N-acetylglucosamine kinase-like BadF-type ATPase
VGEESARRNLAESVRLALLDAGAEEAHAQLEVCGVCAALAGVDRPHDIALARGWIDALYPGVAVTVCNDAMGAWLFPRR